VLVLGEAPPEEEEEDLPAPLFAAFPSTDGATTLFACLWRPDPTTHGEGPWPTVVSVYGGPHVQYVKNSWGRGGGDARARALQRDGFLVLRVDNRGSAERGTAFEGGIQEHMGSVEVEDQLRGVQWFAAKGLVRLAGGVGVFGWSYGGYMTAMCLCKASAVFTVGVSGAPVTFWEGYDTCYTERYMSTPALNGDGYRDSSVLEHAHMLPASSNLLLIHGMNDENVHFRHTARLVDALVAAGKRYDLLLLPSERHSVRSPAATAEVTRRLTQHFQLHLVVPE
jgi:dipeptidyl-peptidase 4